MAFDAGHDEINCLNVEILNNSCGEECDKMANYNRDSTVSNPAKTGSAVEETMKQCR